VIPAWIGGRIDRYKAFNTDGTETLPYLIATLHISCYCNLFSEKHITPPFRIFGVSVLIVQYPVSFVN
jgi:hypothetical protein